MNKLMKTSELTGATLDYWVAKAEDEYSPFMQDGACWIALDDEHTKPFSPSTDWAQGGPLIQQHGICVLEDGEFWIASNDAEALSKVYIYAEEAAHSGPTPLVAAMRAIVAIFYGDTVPDEAAP